MTELADLSSVFINLMLKKTYEGLSYARIYFHFQFCSLNAAKNVNLNK